MQKPTVLVLFFNLQAQCKGKRIQMSHCTVWGLTENGGPEKEDQQLLVLLVLLFLVLQFPVLHFQRTRVWLTYAECFCGFLS